MSAENSEPETVEDVDDLVDEWGEESFPASDPPGCLPPSMDADAPRTDP